MVIGGRDFMNGTHYKLSLFTATRGNRGKKTMCKPGAGGGGRGGGALPRNESACAWILDFPDSRL